MEFARRSIPAAAQGISAAAQGILGAAQGILGAAQADKHPPTRECNPCEAGVVSSDEAIYGGRPGICGPDWELVSEL